MDDLEDLLRARMREPDAAVPAAVDAAVLGAARNAARSFRRRRVLRLVALPAAAAVLIAGWLGTRSLREPATAGAEFDVVDAWRVVRGIERRARFDLDGNGRVDREDADAMLGRIVALAPRRNG